MGFAYLHIMREAIRIIFDLIPILDGVVV